MDSFAEESSNPGSKFDWLSCHQEELSETEQRLKEGKEEIMEWEEAKALLRKQFKRC